MKRYVVNGWYGHKYFMRANELHLRVMNDSEESNFNWIASATELMRICSLPDFPDDYAIDIKIAILNCFANLEGARSESYQEPTDARAVQDAYNSLPNDDSRCAAVKHKYLSSVISAIESDYYEIPIHCGKKYHSFVRKWKKHWFDEVYSTKEDIDFANLRKMLDADFERKLTKLEKSGELDKEDDEFWSMIRQASIDI